jgi:TolB protein
MRRTLIAAGTAALALGAGLAANAATTRGDGYRGANGRIVYESRYGFTLVNPDGSGAVNIPRTHRNDHSPAWSPDGTRLAYQGVSSRGDSDIYVMNGDGSAPKELTFSTAFDGDPAFSGNTVAFESGGPSSAQEDIYTIAADGSHERRLTNADGFDGDPAYSPDWTRIAFTSERDGNREIYVMNTDGTDQTRLTNDAGKVTNSAYQQVDENPVWSPDGKRIAFDSSRDGQLEIYVMNADGSGQTRLTDHQSLDAAPAWSPDGRSIAWITDRAGKGFRDIWAMGADGSRPHRITFHATAESPPDWQPLPAAPPGCTLWGTAGRDLIASGPRGDVVCGGGGNDTLVGGGGRDTLRGGGGDDTLQAKDGVRDVVEGGPGRDRAHVDKKDVVRSIETRIR